MTQQCIVWGSSESEAHLDMSGIMVATCSSATGSSRRAWAQLRVYISGDQEHLGTSTRKLVNTTCVCHHSKLSCRDAKVSPVTRRLLQQHWHECNVLWFSTTVVWCRCAWTSTTMPSWLQAKSTAQLKAIVQGSGNSNHCVHCFKLCKLL